MAVSNKSNNLFLINSTTNNYKLTLITRVQNKFQEKEKTWRFCPYIVGTTKKTPCLAQM